MAIFKFKLNRARWHPYQSDRNDFKTAALKDARIKKLFRMKDEGAYSLDTQSLIQEIEDMHLARRFRNVKTDEILGSAQKRLIDWTSEIVRDRGRCVSIKMECFKVQRLLERQLKDIRAYLQVTYRAELTREYNTLKDKTNAVDEILEPFNKFSSKLDTVLTLSNILIEDLDKAHWSKDSIIQTLNLYYGKTAT